MMTWIGSYDSVMLKGSVNDGPPAVGVPLTERSTWTTNRGVAGPTLPVGVTGTIASETTSGRFPVGVGQKSEGIDKESSPLLVVNTAFTPGVTTKLATSGAAVFVGVGVGLPQVTIPRYV